MLRMLAVLLLSACEHKDLCEVHPHINTVRVVFDWQNAPDANPEGMCVFFYPIDGGNPIRYDFKGKSGGEIDITEGEYRIIYYNNDTEAVLFRNTNRFDSHEAYTREGNLFETVMGNASQHTPRAEGTKEQAVHISPDMLWGSSSSIVKISLNGNTQQIITLYPQEIVHCYTYEVRNVKYLSHVTQVCGSLSGMSGSLFVGSEKLGEKSVTIPFAAESDGISSITGMFYTFGHNDENHDRHHMTFYVWMDDGKKYAYGINADEKFDVTDQIHKAPDKKHIHIVIEGLDLPQPIENGNGYDVSMDDWVVIEEDILL